MDSDVLLHIQDLKIHFHMRQGLVNAVDGVNFQIKRGQILGLVGESGCGKSITARSFLRIEAPGKIAGGEITFYSAKNSVIKIHELDPGGPDIRSIRGSEISMIFQEPMTSFGLMHTIGNQIREAVMLHQHLSKREANHLTIETLKTVGMSRPEKVIDQYPHQLSGGMRQRAMIAMALSCQPSLLIADEPTTALDVTTEAQILDLLRERQNSLKMAILYITHNLAVISQIAEKVIVMYLGKIVESADIDTLFYAPKHPYTQALMRSIPRIDYAPSGRLNVITGTIPDPYTRPAGCVFHPRCQDFMAGKCDKFAPMLKKMQDGATVACHLYEDVQ